MKRKYSGSRDISVRRGGRTILDNVSFAAGRASHCGDRPPWRRQIHFVVGAGGLIAA